MSDIKFDAFSITNKMADIEGKFTEFSTALTDINNYIQANVNASIASAVFGNYGAKMLTIWDQNASTFGDFHANFTAWSEVVSVIAASKQDFAADTAALYRNNGGNLDNVSAIREGVAALTDPTTASVAKILDEHKTEQPDYSDNYRMTQAEYDKKKEEVAEFVKKNGNTQAVDFMALGDKAYNGDKAAMEEWINKVGEIVKNTNTYGMKKSLIIAQIINESGWMHTPGTKNADGSTLTGNNNILGINYDMGKPISQQDSKWSQNPKHTQSNVTQWSSDGSHIVGTSEAMRTYDCIEDCIEDYANVMYLYHPECKGNNNIEAYRGFLEGYTPNPNASTTDKYIRIINNYNLERFDV